MRVETELKRTKEGLEQVGKGTWGNGDEGGKKSGGWKEVNESFRRTRSSVFESAYGKGA